MVIQNLNNIDQILEKVKDVRYEVVEEREEEKDEIKLKNRVLDELKDELSQLEKYAQKLYGYDSVFKLKKFSSAAERYLAGSARQNAALGEYALKIIQIAAKHKIASRTTGRQEKIPAGSFKIGVGERELSFDFRGGNIYALAELFNRENLQDIIRAAVVKKSKSQLVLILEAQQTGSDNKLRLLEDSDGILKFLDLFGKPPPPAPEYIVSPAKADKDKNIEARKDYFILNSGASYEPDTGSGIELDKKSFISGEISWSPLTDIDPEQKQPPLTVNEDKLISPQDSIMAEEPGLIFKDKALESFPGAGPAGKAEGEEEKEPSVKESDDTFLKIYFVKNGRLVTKKIGIGSDFTLTNSGKKNFNIGLKDLRPGANERVLTIDKLKFINNNTGVVYRIKYPQLIKKDQAEQKSVQAKHELTPALDALFDYKGVRVRRKKNTVDDLLDGVTLNLKRPSPDKVEFEVERDMEAVQNSIVNYIGQYNLIMELLNIVLARSKSQADKVDEKEKKKFTIFRNEFAIKALREKMIKIMSSSFPTSDRETLSMLVQIGIESVFSVGGYDDLNQWKKQLKEPVFKDAMQKMPQLVQELFSYDNDGDNLPDSGCAYELKKIIKSYTSRGGVLALQKQANNRKIKEVDRRIAKEEKKIDSFLNKLEKDLISARAAKREMKRMMEYFEQTQGVK